MAQLMRRKSKVLVAFGSCASEGCIPGLGNMNTRKEIFDTVYKEGSATAPDNPQDVRPQHGNENARGHAAPAGLLRHAEDARPDGRGGLLSARLPARGREHLDGHRGDPRRQAAAEGLGDRRRTRPSATSARGSGTRRRSRSSTAPGRSFPTRRPACWSKGCCAAASPPGRAARRFARRSIRPASAATGPTTA